MRTFNLFILFFFLFSTAVTAVTKEIRITGSGKGYSGVEISIFRLSDPVSKSLIPLKRTDCDSSGRFSVQIPAVIPGTVVIKAGIFYMTLFVDSARDMELRLPDFEAKDEEERQNSFFQETRVVPEVLSDKGNINNLVRTFDLEYDPLFNRVADRIMYNTKKNDIPQLIQKLNRLSTPGVPEFFDDFIRFRMVMLNQVANGEFEGRMEDSLFINRKFDPFNPAYTDLMDQMFTKYFRNIAGGKLKDTFFQAVSSVSVKDLRLVISADGKATNTELQDYVILLNLFGEYYDSFLKKDKILGLVRALQAEGSSAYTRGLAENVANRLTSLDAGSIPPALELKNEQGMTFQAGGLKGKYVLISFTKSDNAFSVAEYGILRSWEARFSSDLRVITVLRDRNFPAGLKKMRNMGFGWTVLDGSAADMEEYLYNVTFYPSFLLIGRDGKVALRNCPFPSENFERQFEKILEDEKLSSGSQN
jgi:hypothetical protein